MSRSRRSAAALAVLASFAACGTACIPVNQVEPLSPDIYGTFVDDSARPVVGATMAIGDEASTRPCADPVYHGTTDTLGVFHLAATTRVQKWIMIIPPVERFGNAYALCVPSGVDVSPTVAAFEGRVPFVGPIAADVDTLSCLRFRVADTAHVVCASARRGELYLVAGASGPIQSGGSWPDGSARGTYRLIHDPSRRDVGVYLQWLDANGIARSTVRFSFPPGRHPVVLEARLFPEALRAPCLRVRTQNDPPHWYSLHQATLDSTYELGPPGVMRAVRSCGAP